MASDLYIGSPMPAAGHKPLSGKPIVYAIVVTRNGAPWIEDCLQSLVQSHYPVSVIVVDNVSTDGTPSLVSHFSGVVCLRQDKNLGFGRANNIGIRRALQGGADLVFLLNQDARVHPETIGKLVSCALDHPEFGILSPLHLNGDGNEIDPNLVLYITQGAKRFFSDLYLGRSINHVYSIDFVNAASWLLTRKCLNQVGGFDPLFFMYGEDKDFCNRAALHGFSIGLMPSAIIFHSRGKNGPVNVNKSLWRRLSRMTSEMLVELKRPLGTFVGRFVYLAIDIMYRVLRSFLGRNLREAALLMLAFMMISVRLPKIWKHSKMSLRPEPHWI